MLGNLIRFSPDKSGIVFQPARSEINETVGYANLRNGPYLFLPAEGEKIVRCFIPQAAIESYQIGRPIGEMLVDEKLASKIAQNHRRGSVCTPTRSTLVRRDTSGFHSACAVHRSSCDEQ